MAKIALVLSGGGARGYAHIGIINELISRGHEITSITGTSMGALVGGMYALGVLPSFTDWVMHLKPKDILSLQDFSMSLGYLIKGEKFISKLYDFSEDVRIEQLPIPYCAIATDLNTMKEIVFDRGSLFAAIRASISIPGFFAPLTTSKFTLVDGGLTNPFPLNRIPQHNYDLVVGVNLYAPNDEITQRIYKKSQQNIYTGWKRFLLPQALRLNKNFYSLSVRSFQSMLKRNSAQSIQLYPPNILIEIPINRFSAFDFERAKRIINYGKEKAKLILDEHYL